VSGSVATRLCGHPRKPSVPAVAIGNFVFETIDAAHSFLRDGGSSTFIPYGWNPDCTGPDWDGMVVKAS